MFQLKIPDLTLLVTSPGTRASLAQALRNAADNIEKTQDTTGVTGSLEVEMSCANARVVRIKADITIRDEP